jgi:hypothetical protein
MIIIDDFLPKHEFIALSDTKHWLKPEPNVYCVQEFWAPLSLQNIFFHASLQMWKAAAAQHPLLNKAWKAAVGIEYWTHIFPTSQKRLAYTIPPDEEIDYSKKDPLPKDYVQKKVRDDLDWHHDRDEILYARTGEIRHPLAVAVLYCHEERAKGMGVLEVQQQGYIQEVDPVPNRLVIFDGTKLHRVAGGDLSKDRRSLCTNLWPHVIYNRPHVVGHL